jgi:alpha-2-macroglobulin
MTLRAGLLVAALIGGLALFVRERASSAGGSRSQAQQDYQAGNFRDAFEQFRKLALDPKDDRDSAAGDLKSAIECLDRLGRVEEIDAFREAVIGVHPKNWRLLQAAAESLEQGQHDGFLIAGQFVRGQQRGGGERVSAMERDRVRALQLMQQALPLVKDEPNRDDAGKFYLAWAEFLSRRYTGETWKLQTLTDLSKLPDYEPGRFGWWRGGREIHAPVDADGNPVFYRVPARYEAARSDGERWRFALAQAAECAFTFKNRAVLEFANFLHGQFGVRTLLMYGRMSEADENLIGPDGPFAFHTLSGDETIARLATGVKRFKLPAEFNFLRLYASVAASGKNEQAEQALVTLAGIYEDRRQFPRAAELWRECIRRFGPGDLNSHQIHLDQIVGNWGRFEPSPTQPAAAGRTLGFRFRNGKRLELEAHAVRVEQLLGDVKDYLKTGHDQFEWNEINIANIGNRLVEKDESKYIGERVAQWSLALEPPAEHFDRRIDVAVPLSKAGAYFITAKMEGGNTTHVLLWIADTAIIRKPLPKSALYIVADAVTGKPVSGANVEFFGYKQETAPADRVRIKTRDFAESSDADGEVVPDSGDFERDYQWLVVARGPQGRLAFLGFEQIWWNDGSPPEDYDQKKAFAVTDRPVYRPGQSVKFKFWAREARYDAPENSRFAGQTFKIRITNPKGETALEKSVVADAVGGFDGEFSVPADAGLGQYWITIIDRKDIGGAVGFRVEEYKKPEFEVTVEAPKEPAQLGDKVTATIKASYYFGGPVTKASVHYTVTRTGTTERWYPVGIWDWLYGSGYWWFWPDYTWYPGWSHWGCVAPIRMWGGGSDGPPEVIVDATVPIGADGTVKLAIDTALAKTLHGNLDHRYAITAEVVDQSRRTIVGTGQVLVARKPFAVFVWADHGYYRVGDPIRADIQAQTLDHKPVQGQGVARLYRVKFDAAGKPAETAVQTWDIDTDAQGHGRLEAKASEPGQYRLAYQLTDAKKRTIEGAVVFAVRGDKTDAGDFRFNDLELIADKREYAPGEKVRLLVNTNHPDSTVYLFLRPIGNAYSKPQVLALKGKSAEVEIGVAQADMPNFYVEAVTVANGRAFTETREIVVPPEKRIVNLTVQPTAHDVKPGAKAGVKLKLTDLAGKPIVGSVVLAVYDKSLEYISGGSNATDIRLFFWNWRRFHFPQTESSLARESWELHKRSESAMSGIGAFSDQPNLIVGMAPGRLQGRSEMSGGALGRFGSPVYESNENLSVTMGPRRQSSQGEPVAKAYAGAPIYDANAGFLDKDRAAPTVQPTIRTQFADTAFWAAHLEADRDGLVDVSFPMPENLTTWKVRAWGMAPGTRVGDGDAEIVTTKNLLLRMQAPRFFVETDEVVLSANVHNHLKSAKSVRVVLELEGKTLSPLGETSHTVEIPADGEARVDWRVKAVQHGDAVVRMQALSDEESDAMEMHFPVRIHGMLKTEAYAGAIRPDHESASFQVTVPAKRRVADTLLEIRYSPTLAGAMVDALPYLVSYPHKTTDCTLYRFLPTVITQDILKRMHLDLAAIKAKRTNLNAQEIGDAAKRAAGWNRHPGEKEWDENLVFDNAAVTRLVKDGLRDLTEMQLADGGWGWFSGWGERSDPHITAQIVHGLELARRDGVAIVPGVREKGIAWLKAYQSRQVAWLKNGKLAQPVEPYKMQADNLDALVYGVLVEADVNDREMQDFLYRDRTELSVYAKGLLGLALAQVKAEDRLAMVVRNIDQYLVQDDENQTAWLKLPEGFWWFWYGNETEANAFYLKLLSRTDPKGEKASRLAKYLLNNRKHATYWNSPRDTAIAVEALAEYVVASGEDQPKMTVEVLVDGKKIKEVSIDSQNLFTFDNRASLAGEALTAGAHKIELRKHGKGPLYFNGYLTNFTLEDFITHAGLEVKVERTYYRLTRADATTDVAGSRGQVVGERTEKYRRTPIANLAGGEVKSGDLIEIELVIDSKNDYEHLIFTDPKAAGLEPYDVRSGYNAVGLPAYVELRDEKVTLFLRTLSRGKHSLRYRMRAEIPGKFSALPTVGSGMYAPELKGNSDEMKLSIGE